jgi:LacI family transcriptional regulator
MRVPDDVSIIGFDDVPMASQAYPPLTTIRQPLEQMGRSAVNILLARIAGIELPSDRITLPTDLILRNSTARPAEKRVAQQR